MRLFFTNHEFYYQGGSHPHIPFLCNEQMELLDVPNTCLLYTSPSPRDVEESRMPSSA